jgi:uncharacterized protein (DUF58 family)
LDLFKKYIGALYFTNRFYTALAIVAALFVTRFFLSWLGDLPFLLAGILLSLLLLDYVALFAGTKRIFARRFTPERLSNGDENLVRIDIENNYSFPVYVQVIDEIPLQFQKRDAHFDTALSRNEQKIIQYYLRPVKRGEYNFGFLNVYVSSYLKFIRRRYRFQKPVMVPVYPSFLQMRKYQLLAISNRLSEIGIKKIRRIGHSMEFEQIKEYVQGDDVRTVNWKATARKGQLMVNNFTDEKSQQIYCIIDKGRAMKMPFEGLSLLDYAVNASLVLLNVALLKQDKAGLVTFAEKLSSFLKADKKATQMNSVLEVLYNQRTKYLESDIEKVYSLLRAKVNQRSLIVLFTNFESMGGMHRQLPYLRKIASNHLLLVVFFENTELKYLLDKPAQDMEAIYTKTIAEKFAYEKKLIVKELHKYGILSILTAPENITVNTVNKYLELKARQAI